jgi:competence protein ComGC
MARTLRVQYAGAISEPCPMKITEPFAGTSPPALRPSLIPRNAQFGFTVGELMVIVAVIAILCLLIILPNLARFQAKSSRAGCPNNLKRIGLAYRTWEGDYGDIYPARYFTNADGSTKFTKAFLSYQAMSNELNNPKVVLCPNDPERAAAADFGARFGDSNTSYFVGLDADETMPAMILSGDRNLVTNGKPVLPGLANITTNNILTWSAKIHNLAGNIGLADGSVQQTSSVRMQKFFQDSGTNLIRLAIP